MRIPYFPGCTLHSKAQSFDASARAAARALGIEMEELPEWTCCGATFSMSADSVMGLVAPTRILASAKEAGKLLTLCSFCYNTLKRTNRVIATDAERRRKVTTFIEEDYQGTVQTVHLLEVLRDDIGFDALAKRVTKPLRGLKVAPYYGCLLLRPAEEMGFDDPERPTILERFLASLGCEVVDFPHKTECCGSFVAVGSPDAAQRVFLPDPGGGGRAGGRDGGGELSALPVQPGSGATRGPCGPDPSDQGARALFLAIAGHCAGVR